MLLLVCALRVLGNGLTAVFGALPQVDRYEVVDPFGGFSESVSDSVSEGES